jgi:hypothetical protein
MRFEWWRYSLKKLDRPQRRLAQASCSLGYPLTVATRCRLRSLGGLQERT